MRNKTIIEDINEIIEQKMRDNDDALSIHFNNFDNLSAEVDALSDQVNKFRDLVEENIKALNRIAYGIECVEEKINKKRE